jgi:glutamate-1-semialdehyde 2,1-aminomutase
LMEVYDRRASTLKSVLEVVYARRTPRSREVFERALKVFPGGVTYAIRYLKPYPPFIVKGEGPRVWDVDGNSYVDYWMGHGANILGHAPRIVLDAVAEATKSGVHLGFENPYALEYAELLTKILPGVEMIRFANSGTEANMYAVRLARSYTKRNYIVKVEGGWHGGYDALHTGVTPPFKGPESAGLPEDSIKYTIVVPFNDLEAAEEALKKYPVAAIIVEPVLGAVGCIEPEEGYLKALRDLVDRYDSLLVFDEVITGFRLALGGAQEYFNVKADIAVYGKVVGGGYPGAGAIGGRGDVMQLLDHIKYPDPRSRSFHGGTFIGNVATVVAGYTTVKYLLENRSLYERAEELWGSVRRRVDRICSGGGESLCWATGAGSMVGVHFTNVKPRRASDVYGGRWGKHVEEALNLYARLNGILYLSGRTAHLLPSLVHSEPEARSFIEILEAYIARITRD